MPDWTFNNMPTNRTEWLNMDWILRDLQECIKKVDTAVSDISNYKTAMDAKFEELKQTQNSQWEIINGTWREMLDKLVTQIIPQLITFGLTDDGYFVAYIPEQWKDIMFFTDVSDFNAYPFGRLQLNYEVKV